MLHAALMQAEPLPMPDTVGQSGGAPEFLHLLPAGEIRTVDGRGPYPAVDLAELARRSMDAAGGRMPVDENHSTDLAAPKGGPSPARGWIVALQAREDGLWGEVEWTDEGRRLVAGRAYRHVSPVVTHNKNKRITGILRASLVNRPNMRGLAALHQENSMELLEKLRLQLGLADDADEAAAIAAVAGLQSSMSTHAAELASIAAAAGKEGEEIAVVLNAVQDLADPARRVPIEDVIALQSELAGVAAELNGVREASSRTAAAHFVDGAIRAGKAGVKPLRDHFITRHMADPATVETEINAFPALSGASGAAATPPPAAGDAIALNADQQRIVQLMGIDPEKFKATQAAIRVVEEAL